MATSMSLPCIVFDYGDTTTAYGITDGEHRPYAADELRNKRSWPTSHGWILCCDPTTLATFLLNPQSTCKIALPPFTQSPPPVNSQCSLSHEPSTAAARLTVVIVEPPESTVIWYCHVDGNEISCSKSQGTAVTDKLASSSTSPRVNGNCTDCPTTEDRLSIDFGAAGSTPAWARHEYNIGGTNVRFFDGTRLFARRFVSDLTSCRGKFYYFHSPTEYGVVDFSSSPVPAFTTVTMKAVDISDKAPPGETTARASCYTIEIDGELYRTYVFYNGFDSNTIVDVGVYRMDFRRRKTIRVRSIGDRAIVAGLSFAGWCPAAASGLRPGSIYWVSPFDNCLHVFEMGAKTKNLGEAYKGVEKPHCNSFWMISVHP
uniref:KIB1-4 beta-propeller domain-containing protein n=1 Tax=Leersia perrieri TaxID=77586 RepID=A0A0D9WLI1_9ORYZ